MEYKRDKNRDDTTKEDRQKQCEKVTVSYTCHKVHTLMHYFWRCRQTYDSSSPQLINQPINQL